jgi:predicted nucleic acid-binding protein
MTLKPLRKIAADSNVLLSAVIGKAALKVFAHLDIEVCTTEFNALEVEEYLPVLIAKYGLEERWVLSQWRMLPVKIHKRAYYASHWEAASMALEKRDPDDAHLAALALKEGIPVWSNDHDFEVVPGIKAIPTAVLLTLLKGRPDKGI